MSEFVRVVRSNRCRRATGPFAQVNIKAPAAVIQSFYDLADHKRITFGEALEFLLQVARTSPDSSERHGSDVPELEKAGQ